MAEVGSGGKNKIPASVDSKIVRNDKDSKTAGGVSRRNFLLYAAGTVASGIFLGTMTGCGSSGGGGGSSTTTTAGNFPVLVFTDVHFDPFYDETLFPALNAADPSQWASIFQTSTVTAPSAWGTDTNYPLLALTLANIKQNLGASPFVIFTGDILGHFLAQRFYAATGASLLNPSATDQAAMQVFTDKTVSFFMQQVRAAVGNLPVFFALGNADSYTGLGPDSAFLSNNAELYYTQLLNGTVDQQTFLSTFTNGGYYIAEPAGTNLMVIGLNTFEFSPPDPPLLPDWSVAVAAQLAWLDSTLASAQTAGKNVWLIMHVPPGAAITSTAANVGSNGQITAAGTTMMWDQDYQTNFLGILAKYPGLIAHTLAAHTHMDEFRIMSPGNVLDITGGITPYFGNNPSFKVFTFSHDGLRAIDYTSLNYDLSSMPGQFNSYYTFSTAYSAPGFLGDSLAQLYPALVTNSGKQSLYRGYYLSGNNYTVPTTNEIVPITNTNWPVFWSGIGNMDEQDFINGVNSY